MSKILTAYVCAVGNLWCGRFPGKESRSFVQGSLPVHVRLWTAATQDPLSRRLANGQRNGFVLTWCCYPGNPELQTLKRPPTTGYQFRVSPCNYVYMPPYVKSTKFAILELRCSAYEESSLKESELHQMYKGGHACTHTHTHTHTLTAIFHLVLSAKWFKIISELQRAVSPTPGPLSRTDGECKSTKSWFCLPPGVQAVPRTVRSKLNQDTLGTEEVSWLVRCPD